ncbi:MAG TPA: hypothetical protein OIL76_06305 [Veillonellaceae bacterium]|nr:hypothetical protein [Veillonellaceae bacterium]
MFYIKERIHGGVEVKIEITDENVFCRCPLCGREVAVDLEDVLSSGGGLYGTAVFCERCAEKRKHHGNRPEA